MVEKVEVRKVAYTLFQWGGGDSNKCMAQYIQCTSTVSGALVQLVHML